MCVPGQAKETYSNVKGIVMQRAMATIVICAVLAASASVAQAADKGARLGMLRCDEASGWGMVFGSTRDIKCVFNGAEKGAAPARFTGTIKKYGVDIGFKDNSVILWAVASTSDTFSPGDLAGTYVGATAEVAWAVGLGANVLVGGSKKGFALQPLSVEGFNGANLALGVSEVELTPAK